MLKSALRLGQYNNETVLSRQLPSLLCLPPYLSPLGFEYPLQCNGQFLQPVFIRHLNPTCYSQFTSEEPLTQRLSWDFHIPAPILKSRYTSLPSVSMLMHLTLLRCFFPSEHLRPLKNIVKLASETHLSSQKLNPVFLNGKRDSRACLTEQNWWRVSGRGPSGRAAELCYLFCLHCSPGWYWGVVLVWEPQWKVQLCFVRSPGQSGCCSLCCLFSSGLTVTVWKEGQERGWREWIRSDILFPAEHLCGKGEGNFTIPEN